MTTTPEPTLKPTSASPRPTVGGAAPSWVRHGYVENWKSWDTASLADLTAVFYSFITLDAAPNADSPRDLGWAGGAVYETMTLADVRAVMAHTVPAWKNEYNWQRSKIVALQDYCRETGKKFIWAVGGWSDLKRTISDGQVDAFVREMVTLLQLGGADGIDFDWEHVSDAPQSNPLYAQQRVIVARTMCALRAALDANGLEAMQIIYTPRYNAFWDGGAYGSAQFATDGEGLDTLRWLSDECAAGLGAIDHINFMAYDIAANEAFSGAAGGAFAGRHYDAVVDSAAAAGVPLSKMVMGFEPGRQAYTGVWAGRAADEATMQRLYARGVGGVMWWAMNENAPDGQGSTVGANAVAEAAFAASLAQRRRMLRGAR